jgi:choline dehydrogenase
MGDDAMSAVDSELRVYGIDGLRIADSSILPRVTTGNTMAPCVVIGKRATSMLLTDHGHFKKAKLIARLCAATALTKSA